MLLLAVLNFLSYGKLSKCMAPVEGLDAFYKELDQAYVSQDGKVFVLDNYAVLAQTEIMILPFKDMKKVEVGSQEEFDKIYYLLRDKVN